MTRSDNGRTREPFLVRFAREYGWRAYAIPVLAVITIWVFVDIFTSSGDGSATTSGDSATSITSESASSSAPEATRGPGPDPATAVPAELPPTELPPGSSYAEAGEQTYRVVGRPGATAGKGEEATFRYVVEVENGVDTTAYGGDDAVAKFIDSTLADPRGWTNDPRFRFEHVRAEEDPNLRIQLSSVETTREMCGGQDLKMETSCRTTITGDNVVVLNDSRWARGAGPFEGDLGSYRQYLVNHEVGHAIGYAAHVPCGGDGELAPIMMQQTLSLNNAELSAFSPEEVYPERDTTCRYNAWPYPQPGAAPIPGANPTTE